MTPRFFAACSRDGIRLLGEDWRKGKRRFLSMSRTLFDPSRIRASTRCFGHRYSGDSSARERRNERNARCEQFETPFPRCHKLTQTAVESLWAKDDDDLAEIRRSLRLLIDGPLRTGLEQLRVAMAVVPRTPEEAQHQGRLLRVPRAAELRPDRELLEERYELFRKAS